MTDRIFHVFLSLNQANRADSENKVHSVVSHLSLHHLSIYQNYTYFCSQRSLSIKRNELLREMVMYGYKKDNARTEFYKN